MRTVSLLVVLCGVCSGEQVIMSGSGSTANAQFRYETRVEPAMPGQKLVGLGGGGLVVDSRFHRFLTDDVTMKYFGYDLSIVPEAGGMFRVTLLPLSLGADKLELRPRGAWTQLPLPRLPQPQLVRGRDTIALDLLLNPSTGQKIVDYLFIQNDRTVQRLPNGAPQDYTVDDAPLTISNPRVSANGKLVIQSGAAVSGTSAYVYLPNRGRYFFSLVPEARLGYLKAGEVRGNTLSFRSGSDAFTIDCDAPIAPGGGVFHLYVRHDSSWRPSGGQDVVQWGSSTGRRP